MRLIFALSITSLMTYTLSDPSSWNPISDVSFYSSNPGIQGKNLNEANQSYYTQNLGVREAIRDAIAQRIPTEVEAKRKQN